MGPFLSYRMGIIKLCFIPKIRGKTYENSLFSFKLNLILILMERET
jgi:hypothetical protein